MNSSVVFGKNDSKGMYNTSYNSQFVKPRLSAVI